MSSSFQQLTDVIVEVGTTSNDILTEGLRILDETPDIVDSLLEAADTQQASREQVNFSVREALVLLLEDAQVTQKELPIFGHYITSGLPVLTSKCPFLAQVWYGDMYGTSGVLGVTALQKDLAQQLEGCTRTALTEKVQKKLLRQRGSSAP